MGWGLCPVAVIRGTLPGGGFLSAVPSLCATDALAGPLAPRALQLLLHGSALCRGHWVPAPRILHLSGASWALGTPAGQPARLWASPQCRARAQPCGVGEVRLGDLVEGICPAPVLGTTHLGQGGGSRVQGRG